MRTYTHTGRQRDTNGWRGSGLLNGRYGRTHALNGCANVYSGAVYVALCGAEVVNQHDGEAHNVRPAEVQDGSGVTCRRCIKFLAGR